MTLSHAQIPLPCSLRDTIIKVFPSPPDMEGSDPIARADLVDLLAGFEPGDASLIDTVRRRAAEIGRAPFLSPQHAAALRWVSTAYDHWQRDFPLEQPLAEQLRRLLPLVGATAVSDDHFFTPGAHSTHQILDRLAAAAVGWQRRLGDAGQLLEQRVQRTVQQALMWFQEREIDLAAIAAEVQGANERDQARNQTMVDRLTQSLRQDLEAGESQRTAARGINSLLQAYKVPTAIGDFIKGIWFESAQRVVATHGGDSEEWAQMQRAARHLVESVQPPTEPEHATDAHRQHLEDIVRHLGQELPRWLAGNDDDSIDSAMGLVEYAHLRLMHGQHLAVKEIPLLDVPDEEQSGGDYPTGQWFLFREDDGELRAQLVLPVDNGPHVFANFAGLKALEITRDELRQQVESGRARPLSSAETFSLSLASAAGIDSDEKLHQLIDPVVTEQSPPTPPPDAAQPEEPASVNESSPGDAPPTAAPPEAGAQQPAPEQPAAPQPPQSPPSGEPAPEPPQAPQHGTPPATQEPGQGSSVAVAQRQGSTELKASPSPEWQQPKGRIELDVPMGAWLGFHDAELPIMAKLAVYDPSRDFYIFVNRRGIALRELSRRDLLNMIEQGLVDILEARSYFRDEVAKARQLSGSGS